MFVLPITVSVNIRVALSITKYMYIYCHGNNDKLLRLILCLSCFYSLNLSLLQR